MNAQDKNLLLNLKKIIGDDNYKILLESIGFENYHLIDKTGLDNIRREKLIKIFSRAPQNIVDQLYSANHNHQKIKSLHAVKRLQAYINDESLFHKLIDSPHLIDQDDYLIFESRIPFTFARELINDFGIKNSVIVKIARPHAFIMK